MPAGAGTALSRARSSDRICRAARSSRTVASERSASRRSSSIEPDSGSWSNRRTAPFPFHAAQRVGLADGVVEDGLELEYRGRGVDAHDRQHERGGAAGRSSVGPQLPAVQEACGEVWYCVDPGAAGLAEELAVPGDQRFRNFDTRAVGIWSRC